jgi:Pentapeptide repeats (8 copies)
LRFNLRFFSRLCQRWFPKEQPRLEIRNLDGEVIFVRPWANLAGRNLSYMSFINVDFSAMDLRDTNFRSASLIGCRFVGARMQRADLSNARIVGADLTRTSFGDRASRTEMRHVEGLREALIDTRELVHKGQFNTLRNLRSESKDIPQSAAVRKAKVKAAQQRPLRPRCLLVLGDPMGLGAHGQYVQPLRIKKLGRRRTRYPQRREAA